MHPPDPPRPRAVQTARLFAALALSVFAGQALGYAACLLVGTALPSPAAWAALVAVALAVAGVATAVLGSRRDADAAQRAFDLALADKVEQQRKLRHDIRGALSPVLLVADRLIGHADPAVKRSGEIMVRTVDRATALLAEAGDADANPPGDP